MLARVLSAEVNGIEAFPVEVEVNCGWGDTVMVKLSCNLPAFICIRLGQFVVLTKIKTTNPERGRIPRAPGVQNLF